MGQPQANSTEDMEQSHVGSPPVQGFVGESLILSHGAACKPYQHIPTIPRLDGPQKTPWGCNMQENP
jgi:hypothetical protein